VGRFAHHHFGDGAEPRGRSPLRLVRHHTDFTTDASDATRAFTKKYRERYNLNPDTFASWAYDALNLLALAIRTAGTTDPEAVRKAILGIQDYQGVEGRYRFDAYGDGLHGYNVVRNYNGKIVFIKHVEFPAK